MKQVMQNLANGSTAVVEVPCPSVGPDQVLIRTSKTLLSAGTERMLVDFGKANLLDKARQQPEKVRMVLDKVRTDGIATTFTAVRNKLDQPVPLGYCNVGTILEVGKHVIDFHIGDRVISNGGHAEVVSVAKNLVAKVPANVSDDEATFTVLASVGLQGIRLANPTLGECFVVTGLGLIGLITVQLLKAQGCRVLGLDYDPARLELARQFGAEVVDLSSEADPMREAERFSRGQGVDGVIIAVSTKSSDPVRQAARMSRKRGRIVLIGVCGLELSRADFYEKELTFQVSCSYGPGRYDPSYEQKGLDYPIGFVRWTEQRNFQAILDLLSDGRIRLEPIITHRFPVDEAARAYEVVTGSEPSLGILLEFPGIAAMPDDQIKRRTIARSDLSPLKGAPTQSVRVGLIGAGNYATAVLIPSLKAAGARLVKIASNQGVSSAHAARKFGFDVATTDSDSVINDPEIDAVFIATRHDLHAAQVTQALRAGKHVFVEKPLALLSADIDRIVEAKAQACAAGLYPRLMVGFNRRFAPHIVRLRALLADVSASKSMILTVNAGELPLQHWTQDIDVGGGRIVGEACHYMDLLRYIAGAPINSKSIKFMSGSSDTAIISLCFGDGSVGAIHYFSNGNKSVPKERLEIYSDGRVLMLDNFRLLRGYGFHNFQKMALWRQDKGHYSCTSAFLDSIRNDSVDPIPFEEIIEVSRAVIDLTEPSSARVNDV